MADRDNAKFFQIVGRQLRQDAQVNLSDRSRLGTPIEESRFQYKNISDFLLGFEYGHITGI